MIWHSSNIEDVKKELGVDDSVGLSAAEIPAKIAFYGENKQTGTDQPHILEKILKHLAQPVDIILLVVAAIVFAVNIIAGYDPWDIPIIIFILLFIHLSPFYSPSISSCLFTSLTGISDLSAGSIISKV